MCLARIDISVGTRWTDGKTVDGVVLAVVLPPFVEDVKLTCNVGSFCFDPTTRVGMKS